MLANILIGKSIVDQSFSSSEISFIDLFQFSSKEFLVQIFLLQERQAKESPQWLLI